MSSPPIFCDLACLSVKTPLEVVKIPIPKPPLTGGISLLAKYFLKPGLLSRLNSLITGLFSKYFRVNSISCFGISPIISVFL